MIDREKVLTVLHRRFPGSTDSQLAGAANAIMGLEDEWEEIDGLQDELSRHFAMRCGAQCRVAAFGRGAGDFRLFTRRNSRQP